jgi:hypothetical protein
MYVSGQVMYSVQYPEISNVRTTRCVKGVLRAGWGGGSLDHETSKVGVEDSDIL